MEEKTIVFIILIAVAIFIYFILFLEVERRKKAEEKFEIVKLARQGEFKALFHKVEISSEAAVSDLFVIERLQARLLHRLDSLTGVIIVINTMFDMPERIKNILWEKFLDVCEKKKISFWGEIYYGACKRVKSNEKELLDNLFSFFTEEWQRDVLHISHNCLKSYIDRDLEDHIDSDYKNEMKLRLSELVEVLGYSK